MTSDSITERKITRSLHFDGVDKAEALRQAVFFQEQIGYYLANTFNQGDAYAVTCEQKCDADRTYIIRKGSAILTVETVFGINMSHRESPPRKFYTFTTTTSHRNELLDTTDKANETIEWMFRIVGGLLLGVTMAAVLVLVGGVIGGHFIFLGFSVGSACGSLLGQLLSRYIYNSVEQRLDAKGEITEVDNEWKMLTETVHMLMNDEAAHDAPIVTA